MSAVFHELLPLIAVADTTAGGVGTILLGNAVATTLMAQIPVPFALEVRMILMAILGTSSHATALIVDFQNRPTAGSSAGAVSIGKLTKTLSVNKQGSVYFKTPATRITMVEGAVIAVVNDTANGDAVPYQAWVLVERIPKVTADNALMLAG